MLLFTTYRSICNKAVALAHGELGFTQGKYESVADVENPADILAGIAGLLEPYAFSGDDMPDDVREELLCALTDFQEAFDVDLQEDIVGLSSIFD